MAEKQKFLILDQEKFLRKSKTGISKTSTSTRRDALKKMSMLAFSIHPVMKAVDKALEMPFVVRMQGKAVCFFTNDEPAWEINPSLFGRNAEVLLKESDHGFDIFLRNAEYPSTGIRADFHAIVRRKEAEWMMNIKFPWLNISEEISFDGWLKENLFLKGRMASGIRLPLGRNDSLTLPASSALRLDKRWSIEVAPVKEIELNIFNGCEYYKSAKFSVYRNGIPEWINTGHFSDLLFISLAEPQSDFSSFGSLDYRSHPAFCSKAYPFSCTGIITGRSGTGATGILWACREAGADNTLPSVLMPQGGKTALSFPATRFSKEYNSDGEPFMFAGDIGEAPQWIGSAGTAFAIASTPDYSLLIKGEGNEISFFDLKARLVQSMITINGCSSLPAVYSSAPGINLSFQDQRAVRLQKPAAGKVVDPANVQRVDDQDERAGWIYVNREATRVRFRTDTPILFNIIRPNDFLNLQLEFVNFTLDGNLLKIDDQKSPSFLIVHFPSQHTREEMFKASEKPRVPVKFLRAKSSRVVFKVPHDNEPIPLTLEYLLNWNNFEIQVNYRARWFNTGRESAGPLQQNLQKAAMVFSIAPSGKAAVTPRKSLDLQVRQKKVIAPSPVKTKQIQQPMTAQEVRVAVASSPIGPGRLNLSDEDVVKVLANPELETTLVDQAKGALVNLLRMGEPSKYETSIEAPAWMEISPNQFAGFAHSIELSDEFGEYDESKAERLDISDDITVAPGRKEVSPTAPESRAQVKKVLPAQVKVATGTKQIRMVQPVIVRNPRYKNVVSPSLLRIPPLISIRQGQLFELWHTRMGVKLASGEIDEDVLSDLKTVRVLWSPCATEKPGGKGRPFIEASKNFYSLPEPYQINELVHLTSNYLDLQIENANTKADPRPVKARRLMLSALGAWFDYEFRDQRRISGIALQAWLQRATMGRDHYIKLVMRGYLFPFGHKAVRVIIGERKIQLVGNVYTAVVIVKEYIVVTQPELLYHRSGNQGFVPFPFQRVEIKDLEKQVSTKQIISGQNAFELYEVTDAGKPLYFKIELDDATGQTVRTEVPLLFVEANVTQQSIVVDHYTKNGWTYFSSGPASKPVAYARSLVPGDTMLETRSIMFGARNINYDLDGVKFYPEVVESSVFLKQMEELTGERKPIRIQLLDDNNLSMVFARIHPDEKAELVFGDSEKSGGFLTPNMAITGLSKLTGLTGSALDNLNSLMVVAKKIFSLADKIPKIFGVIDFVDILMPEVNLTGAVSKIKDQIEKIRDQIESVSKEILSVLARADSELRRLNRFLVAISGILENHSITEALKDSEALAQALNSFGIAVSQGTIKEAVEAAISVGREISTKNISITTLEGYINNPSGLRSELATAGADLSNQTVSRMLELVKGLLNNGFEDTEIVAVVNVLGLVSSLSDLQGLIKTLAGDIANRLIESIPEIPNVKFQIKGDEIVVEYHWKPKTKNEFDAVLFQIKNMNSSSSQIEVSVDSTMKKSIDLKSPPRFDVDASIKKFSIVVAKTIQINFERLSFKSGTGSKPDVDLKFSTVPIRLLGSLSFVNNLQKVLNADQFAAGPFIDVNTNGIVAGYNFPLPNIEVGILALSNMMLGTRLKIPFNQEALTLGFNFSSRENPFKVLVSCFGGGGFFSMETTMKGLRRLDAAFEFGAGVSLNLGVASGSVEAMGGFYYCLVTEPEGTSYTMTAYLRLTGRLSILKLIKVTLEFYLELLYESLGEKTIMEDNKPVLKVDSGSRLVGTATLSVKVEILFFSKTVKVTVKRTFSGNDADPKFADTYSLEHWQDYCAAFAS